MISICKEKMNLNEVVSTIRAAQQGAREDIETAKRHRGKLGAAAGAGGTLYLLHRMNKAAAGG